MILAADMIQRIRIRKTPIILLVLSISLTYAIVCYLVPMKVSYYCTESKCISIVVQYKQTISGGDKFIRIYRKRVVSRLFLNFGDYLEYPLETDVLISKKSIMGKINLSSQTIPTLEKGDMSDIINFKKINFYSEGDNENFSTLNLKYKILF